jgi:hypothetical protein
MEIFLKGCFKLKISFLSIDLQTKESFLGHVMVRIYWYTLCVPTTLQNVVNNWLFTKVLIAFNILLPDNSARKRGKIQTLFTLLKHYYF